MSEIRLMTEEELKQQREEKPILPLKICGRCHRPIPYDMRFQRKRKYGLVCQRCLNKLWRAKGYASERDFVRRLEKIGFNADRIPTSGSGRVNLPDIIAFHPEKRLALAFECKAIDGSYHKTWTVNAWIKKGKKRKPSQIVKAVHYLQRHYPSDVELKAGVAIKFLLGERCKSPWIVKLVDITEDFNISKLKDITVDISSQSDMPELTQTTLSKRSRHIRKVRQKKREEKG